MEICAAFIGFLMILLCSMNAYAHECIHDDLEFEPVKLDVLGELHEVETL